MVIIISMYRIYLAGGMDIDQVISLLDSDTADNAKAANDPNWN